MIYGPNRTIFNVLYEIRELDKTKNYSGLLGLISEIQSMANRMEAKLYDQKEYDEMIDSARKLKKEIKDLEKQKAES